jgi:hypothetical protein
MNLQHQISLSTFPDLYGLRGYVMAPHLKISMQVKPLLVLLAFSVGIDSLNFTNVTEPLSCVYTVAKVCVQLAGFSKGKHYFCIQ